MTAGRPGRVRLTGRGWGILAGAGVLAASAYVAGVHELLLAACFAALLVVLALGLVIVARPGVGVRRDIVPSTPMARSPMLVTLSLAPAGSRPAPRGLWRELVPWDEVGGELPAPSSRGPQTLRYATVPPLRGAATIGPLVLRVSDPFGIASNTRASGDAASVTVLPFLAGLDESGLEVASGEGITRLRDNRVTPSDDDLSTRQYRRGDPLRRVHWRASARHGELMVRQEDQHSVPEARLVLETRRTAHTPAMLPPAPDRAESDTFEWSVSMLGSVAVHLTRLGYRLSVLETAERQLPDPGEVELAPGSPFLAGLATVRLLDGEGGLPGTGPADATGPLVAVVGAIDVPLARWLREVRGAARVATVFASGPIDDAAHDLLAGPGWTLRPVEPTDDFGSAWIGAAKEPSRV
jgi:uncharacterized protein (DUF58 family)